MKKTIGLFVLGLLSALCLEAQDIHFTQFNLNPLTLNPANTGNFSGTVRFSGIYRVQAPGIMPSGESNSLTLYTTPAINVDAPIVLGISPRHWVGAGLAFYSDKAGSLGLTTQGTHGSIAYHMGLGGSSGSKKRGGRSSRGGRGDSNKKVAREFVPSKTYVSIGLTYGTRNRSFDFAGITDIFQDEFFTTGQSMDREMLEGFNGQNANNVSTIETGAGVLLSSQLNDQTDFQIGVSAFHILQDDFRLAGGSFREKEQTKLAVHGNLNYLLNDKLSLHPQFLYLAKGEASQIQVQTSLGYRLNEEQDVTLFGGLGTRFGESIQVLLGGQFKNLRVGASWDLITSGLNSDADITNGFNSFELGAMYIVKIYKKPQADPVIFCPRL